MRDEVERISTCALIVCTLKLGFEEGAKVNLFDLLGKSTTAGLTGRTVRAECICIFI